MSISLTLTFKTHYLLASPDDDFYIVEDSLLQHGPDEEEFDSDLE